MKLRVALRSYEDCLFFGPAPAPLARIQGRHRVRLWLKCNADDEFIEILRNTVHSESDKKGSDVLVISDINPYSMS